jgi:hypothetical protein
MAATSRAHSFKWTCGCASHASAGIHVVLDVRHAGDPRAVAGLHVADDTGMRTHDHEVAEYALDEGHDERLEQKREAGSRRSAV